MGCVSSNDVKENDPPIEKTESAVNQKVPEIQINGPSDSNSKENGLSNHHASPKKAEREESEPQTPQKHQSTPSKQEDKPPMFPHVSPFKPQFDYKRDVTLSPRASRHLDENSAGHNGHAGDRTIDTTAQLEDSSETDDKNSSMNTTQDEHRSGRELKGDLSGLAADISATVVSSRTPRNSVHDSEDQTSPVNSPGKKVELNQVEVSLKVENEGVSASGDQPEETATRNSSEESKKQQQKPDEDRSAILASFLDHQAGPDVASSDDESQFPMYQREDPDLIANQVDDDELNESKAPAHPLVANEDTGGKGDHSEIVSALKRRQDNGEESVFTSEERQKLNELLNEIEAIAEKNGRFD